MQSEVIQDGALAYVLVTPDSFTPGSKPLFVLLHGFGASMYDLPGLAPAIDETGFVYAFPNAPYRMQFAPGQYGYSWSANRPGIEPPPEDAPGVEQLLENFVDEVVAKTGAEKGKIVLGGFSQGGGLTLSHGLPRPEVFGALAVLSGFFRDADAVRPRLTPGDKRPVFVAHGSYDNVVAVDGGQATKAFLEELGYPLTYREYPMAHEISPQEVEDLRAWLHDQPLSGNSPGE